MRTSPNGTSPKRTSPIRSSPMRTPARKQRDVELRGGRVAKGDVDDAAEEDDGGADEEAGDGGADAAAGASGTGTSGGGGDSGCGGGGGALQVVPQTIGASFEDAGPSSGKPPKTLGTTKKKGFRRKAIRQTRVAARFFVKAAGVGLMTAVLCLAIVHWPPWVIEDEHKRAQIMSALFVIGIFTVAVEDEIGMNKSAMMLFLAGTMWTFLAVGYRPLNSEAGAHRLHEELNRGLQDVGSVILFLLPAMGVVESIDHFGGFALVTVVIRKAMDGRVERLMPIICVFTFFLSSVIDNLTSTIVALKILKHLAADDEEHRRFCGGMVVLAANAGGAWSPVGDVTTTMLWIQGKITAPMTTKWLILPSLTAGLLPLVGMWWTGNLRPASLDVRSSSDGGLGGGGGVSLPVVRRRRGADEPDWTTDEDGHGWKDKKKHHTERETEMMMEGRDLALRAREDVTPLKVVVLAFGIMLILLVPVLKIWTGLPPYLGMLLALGAMWLVTDALDLDAHREMDGRVDVPMDLHDTPVNSPESDDLPVEHHGPPQTGVVAALYKLDLTGLLFFAGILLSVGALDSAGVLHMYATSLVKLCRGSPFALCILLGLSSAVVDNVPLVQASIDMFKETETDDELWQLVALAAGTGGSILSIGSISGVTLMSMDGVSFMWYLRRIGPWSLISFFAGMAVYKIQRIFFG